MMVPIALAIIDLSLTRRTGKSLAAHGGIPQDDVDDRNLALSLLLGRRLRGVDRRRRHHHRLAAQRHLRALLRAGVRRPDLVHPVDAGRGADDAAVPAARVAAQHARAVPDADPRDRGRAGVGQGRAREARAAHARRARHAGGVRRRGVLLGLPPAAGGHRAGRRGAARQPVGCRHRGRRRHRAVRHSRRSREGHLPQRLEHRGQAAVGRADPVRRRARAGGGHRGERRRPVHRQPGAGVFRLAGDGGRVHDHRADGVHVGADVEHGAGGDDAADPGGARPGARRAAGAAAAAGDDRRQLRVHDAGRHAAQRDRVRHRPRAHAADDEGGLLAERERHRPYHRAHLFRDRAAARRVARPTASAGRAARGAGPSRSASSAARRGTRRGAAACSR